MDKIPQSPPVDAPVKSVKYKQIHVPSGRVEILTHSEEESANYNRALNGANTENIQKQIVWLVEYWNRQNPTHWRYELCN